MKNLILKDVSALEGSCTDSVQRADRENMDRILKKQAQETHSKGSLFSLSYGMNLSLRLGHGEKSGTQNPTRDFVFVLLPFLKLNSIFN